MELFLIIIFIAGIFISFSKSEREKELEKNVNQQDVNQEDVYIGSMYGLINRKAIKQNKQSNKLRN